MCSSDLKTPTTALWDSRIDWIAVSIAAAAAVALLRFKQGVMPVLLFCALAGWAVRAAGWA